MDEREVMTVGEFLELECDIDIYDNVDERLGIAYCGPMELTEAGVDKFGPVLDLLVHINWSENIAVLDVGHDAWLTKLNLAKELFDGLAGYCAESDYDKWFHDPEEDE